jgi:hypothetical protein
MNEIFKLLGTRHRLRIEFVPRDDSYRVLVMRGLYCQEFRFSLRETADAQCDLLLFAIKKGISKLEEESDACS